MSQGFSVSVYVKSNSLPTLPARGRQRAARAVMRAGFATRRGAAPQTPVRTGALKANIVFDVFNSGLSLNVKWAMFYALFQNEGTKRGITAKRFAQKGAEFAWPQFKADMSNVYGVGV